MPAILKGRRLTFDTISPSQCRAARGFLNWTQTELAAAAKVSKPTVADFERGARSPHPNNVDAIRSALEAAGITFLNDDGRGPGVRYKGVEQR